ncbi:DUF4442 domain-containing protein [Mucilaginibacter limnophilus]|uniref:DUF4442 domain-containing protein n=1 Tax=Mucilaginibacter limnophilus TaxID=1932778 RepID=A0A3S2ULV3_9SPHI|nr:DUF4442 domain-containing protein [Mucilaginibacter limnophilus]RVU00898.1 DUF4442 domain-containing protein [Mucilaginibacter limnophilus]
MTVRESTLKWLMRFYPPLFLQRIWVVRFHPKFKGVDIKINKSIFNQNYNKSIFGGSIFSAADPFYPVLFHQIFSAKGYDPIVWLKSCNIQYLKPARTALYCTMLVTDDIVAQAEQELQLNGKFVITLPAEMVDKNGMHCVSLMCEVYVRDKNFNDKNANLTP